MNFIEISKQRATQDGITLAEAMSRIEAERPALHRDFLLEANKENFSQKTSHKGRGNAEFLAVGRARAKRKGISLANALSEIADEQPWLYEGDIPEQPATPSQARSQTKESPHNPAVAADDGNGDVNEDNVETVDARSHGGKTESSARVLSIETRPTVNRGFLGGLPAVMFSSTGALC